MFLQIYLKKTIFLFEKTILFLKIAVIKIKYISTFTIEEFEKKCITKKIKKNDIQTMFEMLKNFIFIL